MVTVLRKIVLTDRVGTIFLANRLRDNMKIVKHHEKRIENDRHKLRILV